MLANLVDRSSPLTISLGQRDLNRRRSLLYLQTLGALISKYTRLVSTKNLGSNL